jgi:hypothetical protein
MIRVATRHLCPQYTRIMASAQAHLYTSTDFFVSFVLMLQDGVLFDHYTLYHMILDGLIPISYDTLGYIELGVDLPDDTPISWLLEKRSTRLHIAFGYFISFTQSSSSNKTIFWQISSITVIVPTKK